MGTTWQIWFNYQTGNGILLPLLQQRIVVDRKHLTQSERYLPHDDSLVSDEKVQAKFLAEKKCDRVRKTRIRQDKIIDGMRYKLTPSGFFDVSINATNWYVIEGVWIVYHGFVMEWCWQFSSILTVISGGLWIGKITHTTVLRLCGICPGKPGWAGTRRNIHPLLSS